MCGIVAIQVAHQQALGHVEPVRGSEPPGRAGELRADSDVRLRVAISTSRAASRDETFGSSPIRRTHQARTSASGCSSNALDRRLIEPDAAVQGPEGFQSAATRGRHDACPRKPAATSPARRSASRRRALRRYQTFG